MNGKPSVSENSATSAVEKIFFTANLEERKLLVNWFDSDQFRASEIAGKY